MADAKVSQDKVLRLIKYVDDLKQKLAGGMFGPKHANAPEVYKAWLKREIDQHTKKIEALRLK